MTKSHNIRALRTSFWVLPKAGRPNANSDRSVTPSEPASSPAPLPLRPAALSAAVPDGGGPMLRPRRGVVMVTVGVARRRMGAWPARAAGTQHAQAAGRGYTQWKPQAGLLVARGGLLGMPCSHTLC
jgi:hypothetical protein